MTLLPKNALIAGTINLGNYENFRFEFGAEINTAEDYLGLVEFAASSLIGQFRGADPQTQETVRAYVARLCSIDEGQVPVLGQQVPNEAPAPEVAAPAPAPVPKKGAWEPKITKSSYDAMQADKAAKQDAAPAPRPSAEEQAAAAVAQVVKPPAAAKAPESFGLCEKCGEAVPANQAKLSQLFQGKTLCKQCMEAP